MGLGEWATARPGAVAGGGEPAARRAGAPRAAGARPGTPPRPGPGPVARPGLPGPRAGLRAGPLPTAGLRPRVGGDDDWSVRAGLSGDRAGPPRVREVPRPPRRAGTRPAARMGIGDEEGDGVGECTGDGEGDDVCTVCLCVGTALPLGPLPGLPSFAVSVSFAFACSCAFAFSFSRSLSRISLGDNNFGSSIDPEKDEG
mmetsp:Transcript_14452/g.45442  ORF Transcript_14452/g.45442 Transcript_14452/m.45442 type:complete len:200 (-) Transcript_14452:199-798(-)